MECHATIYLANNSNWVAHLFEDNDAETSKVRLSSFPTEVETFCHKQTLGNVRSIISGEKLVNKTTAPPRLVGCAEAKGFRFHPERVSLFRKTTPLDALFSFWTYHHHYVKEKGRSVVNTCVSFKKTVEERVTWAGNFPESV
jgi:hypothetical protein